ncbi:MULTISPECIES: hypothetical protein [Pseudomonas]|uniref:hypothetical protein n=1 Tax=Pseudomonas TaxID=286 RepID=UPI001C43E48A|nr:hypothetical protein [Pseudomonas sp. PDM30]MBV7491388.1 hypothetical protein [Pseudomonas sp. PDM30]
MSVPTSSTSSRTPVGKYLVRAAVRAGRLLRQLETTVLQSSMLASVPLKYRQIGVQIFRLIFVLAVASVALTLAIGMVALWTIAALPISADKQPRIHEVSHPQHQLKYPELYDDNGALR